MMAILTKQELQAKGIAEKDILRMLKNTEKRIFYYAKTYAANGFSCSDQFKKWWDNDCAKFDHLQQTLAVFQN